MSFDEADITLAYAHPEPFAAIDTRIDLMDAVSSLPARQRHLIETHYHHDVDLKTVAAQQGVSPQRISQVHLAALQRLRDALTEGD